MKPGHHKRARIRGSALFYSLMTALLVTLLLGSMLVYFSFTRSQTDFRYGEELARDNMESGRNLTLYGKSMNFGKISESLFNSENDSFTVFSRTWGLFALLTSTGIHGKHRCTETILFGAAPEDQFDATLFLTDRNRPLTLAGDTRLRGVLYLPEAGLKRGFVGRTGYTGEELYEGIKHESKDHIVKLDYQDVEETQQALNRIFTGSISADAVPATGDSIHVSWENDPVRIASGSALILKQVNWSGPVILQAPRIIVTKEASLDHVLLFAKQIRVEKGFRGKLQAFATDTLIVEEDTELLYPSVALVSHPEGKGNLYIGKRTSIEGMVINDPAFLKGMKESIGTTTLDSGAVVYGHVYVPLNLDLKGKVCGSVITGSFVLRTPSAVYENHLLDAVIQEEGRHKTYAMGLVQPATSIFRSVAILQRTTSVTPGE